MMITTLCCEGDSLSAALDGYFFRYFGANTVDPGVTPYGSVGNNRSHFWPWLSAPRRMVGVNYAIAGTRLTGNTGNMTSRAVDTLDLLVPATKANPAIVGAEPRKYVLFLLAGTNPDTSDPAVHAAAVSTYAAARKAAGWDYVVVGTLPSRTDGVMANFDTTYQAPFNALLRAGLSGVDGYVDFAADAEIGAAGAADNATYFTDKVHPSAAGRAIMAARFTTEMNTFLTSKGL